MWEKETLVRPGESILVVSARENERPEGSGLIGSTINKTAKGKYY